MKSVKFTTSYFYSIIENLYLSDQIASFDENIVKKNNIQCLINCTKNTPFLFNDTINIHLKYLNNIQKYSKDELNSKLNKTIDYIHKIIATHKNVLIYCENGQDNSITIIYCYLLKYYNKSISNIVQILNTKINNNILNRCSNLNICKDYRNYLLHKNISSSNSSITNIENIETSSNFMKMIKNHFSGPKLLI